MNALEAKHCKTFLTFNQTGKDPKGKKPLLRGEAYE
jgi:hypothetical protein